MIVINVFLLSFSGYLNRVGQEWWLTLIAWPSWKGPRWTSAKNWSEAHFKCWTILKRSKAAPVDHPSLSNFDAVLALAAHIQTLMWWQVTQRLPPLVPIWGTWDCRILEVSFQSCPTLNFTSLSPGVLCFATIIFRIWSFYSWFIFTHTFLRPSL